MDAFANLRSRFPCTEHPVNTVERYPPQWPTTGVQPRAVENPVHEFAPVPLTVTRWPPGQHVGRGPPLPKKLRSGHEFPKEIIHTAFNHPAYVRHSTLSDNTIKG